MLQVHVPRLSLLQTKRLGPVHLYSCAENQSQYLLLHHLRVNWTD